LRAVRQVRLESQNTSASHNGPLATAPAKNHRKEEANINIAYWGT